MARPTYIEIDANALRHNVARIKAYCPQQKVIAMVKANAYGCGLTFVVPVLDTSVDAFGVACLEEAIALRKLTDNECILFQGVFSSDELHHVVSLQLQCVIHHALQLEWLLKTPLKKPIRVWVKVNTGMQRLGFSSDEALNVLRALNQCGWVDKNIGLMTHIACADDPTNLQNQQQFDAFAYLDGLPVMMRSIANSAVILSRPDQLGDIVRPGVMLYGVSPFADKEASAFDLKPVMRFISAISVIHDCPTETQVGYGGSWKSARPSRIGVVAVGYGDGYPRHIAPNTPTWINGHLVPIVGRVSMDMLTVDLTDYPDINIGDQVELWGHHLPVEVIARAAGTIAYELICQVSPRVRERARVIST